MNNEYVYRAASAYRQDVSPLLKLYFSDSNINTIQSQLKSAVKKNTNVSIDKQNPNELFIVMQYIYSNFARHCTVDHVQFLNNLTLNELVPMVSSNVLQHIGYMKDISSNYVPMERSVNPSIKGNNTNEFKSFF